MARTPQGRPLAGAYFHCVFTLPHELNPLILQNKHLMLGLLFRSVNETLCGFAKEPKWKLEGQPGFIAVLHTWNQELGFHPHVHALVPGGGPSEDQSDWKAVHKKGMVCFIAP